MPARRWIGLAALAGAAGALAALVMLGGRAPSGEPALDAARTGAPAPGAARTGAPAPGAARAGAPAPDAAPALAPQRAEPRSVAADARAQADALVASAMVELAAGRLARGRDLLARAYALDPQPATLLALGRVDLQAGRCRDARRAVQGALAATPPLARPLADEARALLAEIGRCD